MKQEDLKKSPKLFCESVSVAFTSEYFILALSSGNQGAIYSLTPQHAKGLQQYLSYQLKMYEEKYGEINATWDPSVVSPVQRINPPTPLS